MYTSKLTTALFHGKSALRSSAPCLSTSVQRASTPVLNTDINLEHFWMPFTNNRGFKAKPNKIVDRAQGMYYYLEDGTELLDGSSGLWCVNAGHGQERITDAIVKQVSKLDYAPSFGMASRAAFELAEKIIGMFDPSRGFRQVFFTQCGSTAIDTAMKMALGYHRARGEAQRTRFISRDKAYHGVNFGGVSVSGLNPNRKAFSGSLLPNVSHMPHTHSLKDMAFSKGCPTWGAHLADDLEKQIAMFDASTIAAVMVEPVIGAGGVIPPPVGYLARLREICNKHNILLIFDEVITGFGRTGAAFATEKFNVTPDMLTVAKGMTNAAVPAGAVIVQGKIYDTMLAAADRDGHVGPEFFHGYTYSGHPLAMAAGLAAIEVYEEQKIFENCARMEKYWEEGLHSLKGLPHVVDIRNIGLLGGVELATVPNQPNAAKRSGDILERAFSKGLYCRIAGPSMTLSPPLIAETHHIDRIVNTLADAIVESAKELKL